MTLFSDESTISEEVPIDYENKVAIYDDYCDNLLSGPRLNATSI